MISKTVLRPLKTIFWAAFILTISSVFVSAANFEYYFSINPQLKVSKKINHFNISSRNRLEYHIDDKLWKYRNMLKIQYKLKEIISIWTGDEIRYSFKKCQFFENEFLAGCTIIINKSFSSDIFYDLRQIRNKNSWERAPVLRTSLNINF